MAPRRFPDLRRRAARAMAALVLASLLAGCFGGVAGGTNLRNEKDHFEYEVGGAVSSMDLTWIWATSGGDVRVRLDLGGATGDAKVDIKDSRGRLVFSEHMSGAGGSTRDQTLRGMPAGDWEIRLVTGSFAGGLTLRVDRV